MEEVENLPFEKALVELESIVEKLEDGSLSLDESVAIYRRGRLLADHCQKTLDGVTLEVEKIIVSDEGDVTEESFKVEE